MKPLTLRAGQFWVYISLTIYSIDIKAILVVSLRIGVVGVLQGDIGWYKEHVYTIFTLLMFFINREIQSRVYSKRKFVPLD